MCLAVWAELSKMSKVWLLQCARRKNVTCEFCTWMSFLCSALRKACCINYSTLRNCLAVLLHETSCACGVSNKWCDCVAKSKSWKYVIRVTKLWITYFVIKLLVFCSLSHVRANKMFGVILESACLFVCFKCGEFWKIHTILWHI